MGDNLMVFIAGVVIVLYVAGSILHCIQGEK